MTPYLSVVIPAFNVAPFIVDAVKSALAQTMAELEVIVVDDGSTDCTSEKLSEIFDRRLRVIRKANGGLAAARNTGIRAASGVYVGFLDGDDLWAPIKAENQLALLERSPDLVLTYSHSEYIRQDGTPTGDRLVSWRRRPSTLQMIRRNHVGNGSTPIGRTADFKLAGFFDERLRTNHEDYEMWPRLMRATGRGIELVPQVLTYYRLRADSLSVTFNNFLYYAEKAYRIMCESMDDVPRSVLREGLAGHYRIAARKAASLGHSTEAVGYLTHAVRLAPWIPLCDPRFVATLALVVSGGRGQHQLHRVIQRFVPMRGLW